MESNWICIIRKLWSLLLELHDSAMMIAITRQLLRCNVGTRPMIAD